MKEHTARRRPLIVVVGDIQPSLRRHLKRRTQVFWEAAVSTARFSAGRARNPRRMQALRRGPLPRVFGRTGRRTTGDACREACHPHRRPIGAAEITARTKPSLPATANRSRSPRAKASNRSHSRPSRPVSMAIPRKRLRQSPTPRYGIFSARMSVPPWSIWCFIPQATP